LIKNLKGGGKEEKIKNSKIFILLLTSAKAVNYRSIGQK